MLRSVRFKKAFRCFPENQEFFFRDGVNLMVGDQGSGKSTLLSVIRHRAEGKLSEEVDVESDGVIPVLAYDAERDNPRTLEHLSQHDTAFTLLSQFQSHGETMNQLLESFLSILVSWKSARPDTEPLVLLDEPDLGLSIRSCFKLIGLLHSLHGHGAQILCVVHNPVVIEHFDEVLDVESRCWRTSSEFVLSQRGAWALLGKSTVQL